MKFCYVGNKLKYLVIISETCKSSYWLFITASQNVNIVKQVVLIFSNFFIGNLREKKIDVNTLKLQFDNGHISFSNQSEFSHVGIVLQHGSKKVKEVFCLLDVDRANN